MNDMTYRHIIQEEYNFRSKENPAYSLRAFARDLEIGPSQLSEILNEKIGLSSKKAISVARKLGLSDKETLIFKALVEVEHGRSSQIVEGAQEFLKHHKFGDNFQGLTLDGFKVISEWHNFAILSCMELDNFDGTVAFIANSLDLPLSETEESVVRMVKMNLVGFKDGKFVPTGVMLTTTHNIASSALKKFHKGHIAKSLSAIDEVAVELRDITSMTMAIDVDKIPEAKEMIKNFRRQLCQVMESGKKQEVYNLNIQLIPLSGRKNHETRH